jgi:hypothetical protein
VIDCLFLVGVLGAAGTFLDKNLIAFSFTFWRDTVWITCMIQGASYPE